MASKLNLAFAVVAIFAVLHQQAYAASVELSPSQTTSLEKQAWVPFKICLKGSDICQKLIATAADDLDESLLNSGVEPIVLHVDEEQGQGLPLSEVDISSLGPEQLNTLYEDFELDKLSPAEIEKVLDNKGGE